MLVVVPIAILVVIGLISAMIVMIGDSLVANGRVTTAYTMQDTLNRIEQDTRISIHFMDQFSYFNSPQGRDNGTSAFKYSDNGDLILTQQATTASPYDTTRDLIYYANQPASCDDSANVRGNRTLKSRTIYFLDASKTLWRRTIVNPWVQYTTGVTSADAVCAKPWQRRSCAPSSTNATVCQSKDEKMLSNVSNFTVTYYDSSNAITTNPSNAESVGVRITADTLAGGTTITQTSEMRATRRNDVATDAKPTTPSIGVLNANLASDNNPLRASFQWSAIGAMAYTYQVQQGAGAWSTPITTTSTTTSVTTTPGTSVQIRVQAINDTGTSDWATFPTSATSPNATAVLSARFPYTNINLDTGNWQCYGSSSYSCPSFTRTTAGLVVLRGMVKAADGVDLSSQTDVTIGTLPAGFRPRQTIMISSLASGNTAAFVVVTTDGRVVYSKGSSPNGWLSLDNIRFPAKTEGGITGAALSTDWTQPTYPLPSGSTKAWSNYTGGGGYGTTAFATDSLDRSYLYGLVTAPTPNPPPQYSNIATVPSGFGSPSGETDTYPNVLVGPTHQPSNYMITSSSVAYRLPTTIYSSSSSLYAIYYRSSASATWNSPSLKNSWTNYGRGYAPAGYIKATDNYVMLRGSIGGGSLTSGTVLFTLPKAYCPSQTLVFNVAANKYGDAAAQNTPVAGRIDVYAPDSGASTCNVKLNSTTNTVTNLWISLAGIGFYQDGGS